MTPFTTCRRLLAAAPLLLVGTASTGACDSSHFRFEAPLGYVAAPVSFGACNTDDGYAVLANPSTYCGETFPACQGATYAICDGSAWSGCICDIPAYYNEVKGAVFELGDGGGADAADTNDAIGSGP